MAPVWSLSAMHASPAGQRMAYKRLEDATFTWSRCPAVVCLQTMRGGDQGWGDGAEPCPVQGAVCRSRLAPHQGAGNTPPGCGRMNHPIGLACFYQMILVILMHAERTDPRSFRHPCRATRGGSGIAGRGGSPQEYHQAARASAFRGLKANHFRPMDCRIEPRPAW